jgi:hypothetical protein
MYPLVAMEDEQTSERCAASVKVGSNQTFAGSPANALIGPQRASPNTTLTFLTARPFSLPPGGQNRPIHRRDTDAIPT